MTRSILEVENLSRNFSGVKAVSDLSFKVKAGGIKAVIGPNGAGKSTLFNMIAGVTPPSKGSIAYQGKRIDGLSTNQRAALGIARTFQNLQIFKEMTVLENVMTGMHLQARTGYLGAILSGPSARREEREIAEKSMALLERFGLDKLANYTAGDLSFGQAKILELSRALACDPELLLLDEPAAGLPHAEARNMADRISELNKTGVTILLVEHNMRMVMELSDDILVLNNGEWIAEGTPDQVRSDPDVISAYLGEETHA